MIWTVLLLCCFWRTIREFHMRVTQPQPRHNRQTGRYSAVAYDNEKSEREERGSNTPDEQLMVADFQLTRMSDRRHVDSLSTQLKSICWYTWRDRWWRQCGIVRWASPQNSRWYSCEKTEKDSNVEISIKSSSVLISCDKKITHTNYQVIVKISTKCVKILIFLWYFPLIAPRAISHHSHHLSPML